jgi:hypothetical protein
VQYHVTYFVMPPPMQLAPHFVVHQKILMCTIDIVIFKRTYVVKFKSSIIFNHYKSNDHTKSIIGNIINPYLFVLNVESMAIKLLCERS